MSFYMPAKVYSEANCVNNHSAELAALGTRALIVTGKNSARRCGAFGDVTAALEKHGVTWVEFAEVEENPSVETIMRARKVGCKVEADFVIGIGGGSPMDAAKAVALMMKHSGSDWPYLYDKSAETSTLPIALIPTTAGTGSEVTAVSVLTRHDKKVKGSIPHKIFAQLALIDGKYVSSAPAGVLANTTMDALCHLYESYIHSKATDYSRMCAEQGIRVWARSKDVILGKRAASAEAEYDECVHHGRNGDRPHGDLPSSCAQLPSHLQRPHGSRKGLRLFPGRVSERGGPQGGALYPETGRI